MRHIPGSLTALRLGRRSWDGWCQSEMTSTHRHFGQGPGPQAQPPPVGEDSPESPRPLTPQRSEPDLHLLEAGGSHVASAGSLLLFAPSPLVSPQLLGHSASAARLWHPSVQAEQRAPGAGLEQRCAGQYGESAL